MIGISGNQAGKVGAADWRAGLRGAGMRAVGVAALIAAAGVMMRDRLAELDAAAILSALAATPIWALVAALGLTAISHMAIAGYDLAAFRQIGRRIPAREALKGGFVATSMAQTLGFGVLTGSFARWRMHAAKGLTAAEAASATAFVSLGFFAGLTCLLILLTLIDPSAGARLTGLDADEARSLALILTAVIVAFSLRPARAGGRMSLRMGRVRLRAPDGRWLASSAALAAADLIPAALVLWLLLPSAPAASDVITVYAVAMALGLLTGAPGGFGAFEAVLLVAFPLMPASDLAAGMLLYRAVYHGPTLALALVLLSRAPRRNAAGPADAARTHDQVAWVLDDSDRAEGELAFLGDKHFHVAEGGEAFVMYGMQGRWRVVLGDPIGPRDAWGPLMDGFEAEAKRARAKVAIYKAEDADFWRARGMNVQPLGEEASLDANAFSLQGPKRRELRRKLAATVKAGVEVAAYAPGAAPIDDLTAVTWAWSAGKTGREQRFSLGAWDPDFVARHHVFVARVEGQAVAFLSLWRSGRGGEWMVDLMRQLPDAPDGVMHALMVAGIEAAGKDGPARFNLCMAPLSGLAEDGALFSRLLHKIYEKGAKRHGLKGLRRFKDTYRPDWTQRHMATRSALGVPGAMIATARLVRGAPQPVMPVALPKRGIAAPGPMPVAAEALPANVLPFSRAKAMRGLRVTAQKLRRRA